MRHAIRTLVIVLLALPVLDCARIRAEAALREGHRLYKEESFRKAADEYTIVLQQEPSNMEAVFYLGSSYHQLYRPGKDETQVNLDEAVKLYKAVLASTERGDPVKYPILKRNALTALTSIYADDPYRDFDASMKYALELTSSEPTNLQYIFSMANLYEKFGKINEAEESYKKAFSAAPKDAKACGALAGFYNKTLWDENGTPVEDGMSGRGRFNDAVGQLKVCAELNKNDPQGYYTVATYYWDQCYRAPDLDPAQKKGLADEGMEFVNKALAIKGDFVEALVYKGLLLREQAKLTTNPATRNSLLEEAQVLQKQAGDLKKQQDEELAEKAKAAAAVASN
jgi:tetratricopeptide (TPR) repeat protein